MRLTATASLVLLVTLPACDPSTDEAGIPRSTTSTYASTAAPCDPSAGHVGGDFIEIALNPDVASPRCVRPRQNERLRVINPTAAEVTVSLKDRSSTIPAGGSYTFPEPPNDWLGPGDHCLETSLYPGSCIEIYVVTSE
jgi:hypothetical protein